LDEQISVGNTRIRDDRVARPDWRYRYNRSVAIHLGVNQMCKLVTAVCVFAASASLATAQQKKSIAILNFDYSTVQSGVAAIFGTNQDIGKGVADLLVEKLVKSGQFRVIERKAIDKILSEQNFSNSDRADPNTAAKIGRLMGADAMVMGSITQFGRDDKKTNVGGSVFGSQMSKYGLGGVGASKAKAVVGLSARMVSVNTGEILAVANGVGESTRTGTSLVGSGGGAGSAAAGLIDMTSTNFANTVLGEAVNAATQKLATELDGNASRLPTTTVTLNGLVADVSGDSLVLNIGSRAGVKVGDKLTVSRVGREIRDPATGKVIRRVEDKLGEITISEVDEGSAVGKYSGTGQVKVGDAVKN
jgi:curli biogenesis system outer membrane secretion channel CsgG